MFFQYRARDPLGRIVDGEMECSDQNRCELELRGRALEPIRITPIFRESIRSNAGFSSFRKKKERMAPDVAAADVMSEEERGLQEFLDSVGDEPATTRSTASGKMWTMIVLLYVAFQLMRGCMG